MNNIECECILLYICKFFHNLTKHSNHIIMTLINLNFNNKIFVNINSSLIKFIKKGSTCYLLSVIIKIIIKIVVVLFARFKFYYECQSQIKQSFATAPIITIPFSEFNANKEVPNQAVSWQLTIAFPIVHSCKYQGV